MWGRLAARSEKVSTDLQLAAADMLKELRDQLNEILSEYDEGTDLYLTRVDYRRPLADVRRYDEVIRRERAARDAPRRIQRRIGWARWLSGLTATAMTVALVAAGFEDTPLPGLAIGMGLWPARLILIVGGVFVIAGFAYSATIIRPYRAVEKAEGLALSLGAVEQPSGHDNRATA